MKILIIIPTYNEKQNISAIIDKIEELSISENYSILVVDDSSTDGTIEEIKTKEKEYNNIILYQRPSKLGLASAYIEGIKFGIKQGFDCFIEMDADFSHNPKYLIEMIEKLKENDVVIGSRNIKGGKTVNWGIVRNIISKGGSLYSRLILQCPIKDLTGGFNGWKKEIIEKINLDNIVSKGYSFQIEMKYKAHKNKAKIAEFPIVFEDRKYGASKMSKAIFFEALLIILKIRFLR